MFEYEFFDSHFHIIDKKYPLSSNQGYTPDEFSVLDYVTKLKEYRLVGGVVVSGSFQGHDQSYFTSALSQLGERYFGITQLRPCVSDNEIISLHKMGIRGLRFNLNRLGREQMDYMLSMASRVYELCQWHVELYLCENSEPELISRIKALPKVAIDHMSGSKENLEKILRLHHPNLCIKASGFGRVNFNIKQALSAVYSYNPSALMFGSDLPSTRAKRQYEDSDLNIIIDTLGPKAAKQIFMDNAIAFYNVPAK